MKINLEELENLMNEYLLTLDNGIEWWDGIQCSERGMAKSFLINGRAFGKSFLQWLREKDEQHTATGQGDTNS